jgi:cytochrome c-type biogenesis protein CcmH
MSGWLAILILIALALGALWLLRVRGPMLQIAAAATMFGAIGYAVQGHPALPSSPRSASSVAAPIPLTPLRHAFYGQFTPAEHWLVISESFARRGSTQDAAGILRSAVREHPNDSELWVGLGNALVDHAGMMTPAADLAYSRAAELAPGHPAPVFFMGLALARSGDGASALAMWRSILASAPANASWRPVVEDAVAALEAPTKRQP